MSAAPPPPGGADPASVANADPASVDPASVGGADPPAPARPSVGRSVLWIVLSRVVVLPLSLLQGAILARQLQPAGLGRYSALLTDVNLAVTLLSLGLPGALSVLVGEQPQRLRRLLALSLRVLSLGFVLPGATLLLLAFSIPGVAPWLGRLPIELLLLVALATVQFVRDALNSLLLGSQEFRAQNVQALFISVFQLAICLGLYAAGLISPRTALCIQLCSHIVLCLMAVHALRRVARRTPRDDTPEPGLTRRALTIGTRNFMHVLPDLLLMRIDVYLLQGLLAQHAAAGQLGLYQAGVRIAEMVLMVPSALNAVLFAKAAAREDLTTITVAGAKLSLLLGFCCLLGMAVVGQPLLLLFYGPRFAGSFLPCLLVLLGCCALCYSSPLAGTLAGAGAYPRSVIIAQVLALLANVGANLFLIPRYGAVGAAAASALSYTVSAAVLTVAFSMRFSVPLRALLLPESPFALVRRVREARSAVASEAP